jgi:hypothetical protein
MTFKKKEKHTINAYVKYHFQGQRTSWRFAYFSFRVDYPTYLLMTLALMAFNFWQFSFPNLFSTTHKCFTYIYNTKFQRIVLIKVVEWLIA